MTEPREDCVRCPDGSCPDCRAAEESSIVAVDLHALHEAATPGPWEVTLDDDYGYHSILAANGFYVANMCSFIPDDDDGKQHAALIVALRNAYASGNLIEREKVEAAVSAVDEIERVTFNCGVFQRHEGSGCDCTRAIAIIRAALDTLGEEE